MYYIKQLQFQELGSPKADGSVSRGRYLLISKSVDDCSFFPPLSKTQKNDTIFLPIVSPHGGKKVYCSYVYHNDKYQGSIAANPRDEYRLYLNNAVDPNKTYFKPSDIVVFQRIEFEGGVPLYKIYLFRKGCAPFEFLSQIVSEKGSHVLYDKSLAFIEEHDTDIDVSSLETVIEKDVEKRAKEFSEDLLATLVESDGYETGQENTTIEEVEVTKGSGLFNSAIFRDFVLHAYQDKCAVTNKVICYKQLNNLEAAHIKPKAHKGTFLPCNGIAMSRDIHWAFDKGMFTITKDYKIEVHGGIQNTILNDYDGQGINVPDEDYFKPEHSFLDHHREHVFGLYKHSGMIKAI